MILLLGLAGPATTAELVGRASVIDSDTMDIRDPPQRPDFQRQLRRDPAALVEAGKAALTARRSMKRIPAAIAFCPPAKPEQVAKLVDELADVEVAPLPGGEVLVRVRRILRVVVSAGVDHENVGIGIVIPVDLMRRRFSERATDLGVDFDIDFY